MSSFFFSDNPKDFSEEYNNIFVPVSENPAPENNKSNQKETVKISDITFPKYGEQFGELIIEDCQINNKLFFGDNDIALNNGVGIYNGSAIPGYGKTILVAGHNNTYFNGLKYAKKGQKVKMRTSYGNYTYEITDIKVRKATDRTAYDLAANYENLIMYTCYPFDELGLTPDRCFVYAKFVSGPEIDKNN
ncbi:MAG: class D sortase [Clostridia bacterium]|nr:class D sortase [Clostridia bacterium]